MSELLHSHRWRLLSHIDGCHFWSNCYLCECGASRVDQHERDRDDVMFLIAEGWLTGCERCDQLHHGAAARDRVVAIEGPDV